MDISFEKALEAMKHCIRQEGCTGCPIHEEDLGFGTNVWYIDGRRYDTCCEGISAFTLKVLKEHFNVL